MSLGRTEDEMLKKLRSVRLLSVWNSKAVKWNWLVPLFVTTLIAAPPASPCSASKSLVVTFTVSMDSAGGTYRLCAGSEPRILSAPSSRVLLLVFVVPLILVLRDRPGEPLTAF